MPRSGNTLFSTVMSQNPKIAATANSVTLEIMKDLFLLKQTDVFQNFPDHKSLDNVLDVVFDTYYKDWPQEIIIDRGPVMTFCHTPHLCTIFLTNTRLSIRVPNEKKIPP